MISKKILQNIEWIECGLPYYFSSWGKSKLEYPDLSNKEKEKFGATWEEMEEKYWTPAFDKNLNIIDENLLKIWDKFNIEHNKWVATLPEVKQYDSEYEKERENDKKASFSGLNLNQPGTLIELEDGTIHLIGTINKHKGVCDDCVAFSDKTIVKRYAVLFDMKDVK